MDQLAAKMVLMKIHNIIRDLAVRRTNLNVTMVSVSMLNMFVMD